MIGRRESDWETRRTPRMPRPVEPPVESPGRFGTGAVRSTDADDVRYDLISPIALRELARTYAEGVAKYGAFNCERGFPVHDLLNHTLRHIFMYLSGDRSEPHLPHAMWNVGMAIHSEAQWPHLNEGTLRGPGCTPPVVRQPETEEELLDAAESVQIKETA